MNNIYSFVLPLHRFLLIVHNESFIFQSES
jgi:hypothetical protein